MDNFMPGSILKRTFQGIRVRRSVLDIDPADYLRALSKHRSRTKPGYRIGRADRAEMKWPGSH